MARPWRVSSDLSPDHRDVALAPATRPSYFGPLAFVTQIRVTGLRSGAGALYLEIENSVHSARSGDYTECVQTRGVYFFYSTAILCTVLCLCNYGDSLRLENWAIVLLILHRAGFCGSILEHKRVVFVIVGILD